MIKEVTLQNFEQEVGKSPATVVEFYTPTCSHCKKLAGALEKLAEELGDGAVIAKCNVAEEQTLGAQYDITSVPTLLFFKEGREKNRMIGEVHPLIIQEEIKKLS
jgi:thioredoxin 1